VHVAAGVIDVLHGDQTKRMVLFMLSKSPHNYVDHVSFNSNDLMFCCFLGCEYFTRFPNIFYDFAHANSDLIFHFCIPFIILRIALREGQYPAPESATGDNVGAVVHDGVVPGAVDPSRPFLIQFVHVQSQS